MVTRKVEPGVKQKRESVPGGIRTHGPLLRRQPLCPAELQGRPSYKYNSFTAPLILSNARVIFSS